jgi:beta-galactosidase
MEQQPGPVNWARWNPAPAPGMVRLWSWEALAHGADAICYFRWRQAPFAQEQMHAGLRRPDDVLDTGGEEARQVAAELKSFSLPKLAAATGDVAIVYDYEAMWMHEIQPQGQDFSAFALAFAWYGALRRLGLNIDFVPSGADLKPYRLVIVPSLPHVSTSALAALEGTSAVTVLGPRSGAKTQSFQIPSNLPPGPLQARLGLKVTRVESLRPGLTREVTWGNRKFQIGKWSERLELTHGDPLGTFDGGEPALVMARDRFVYVASWADGDYAAEIMRFAAKKASLGTVELPPDFRIRRRGGLTFGFNYGSETVEAPISSKLVPFMIGSRSVKPHEVAIWRN